MNRVVLGSRGSRLALAQVELVRKTLEQLSTTPEIKVRIVRTTGDRRLDISLSHPGPKIDKGLFTKELEEALLSQEIDVAVHSLKDLPTELPRGLELAATLPRHDPVDVLISKTASRLSDVPVDGLVATSSPRRARQIVAHRPDLQIVDIRGNVPTRIVKLLAEDSWDALVLAKAGLERLGYRLIGGRMQFETHQLFVTDLLELLPAPGQGAIGLETRSNDKEIHQFLGQINDGPTWFCTSVEREFLRLLGGGCSLPLGIRTTLNGSYLTCEAIVFDESDKPRFGTVAGEYQSPVAAASELLNRIYEKGK